MAKNAAPFTVKRDLNFLDSRVLSHLKAFDLNGCILSQEPFVVGMGSYSDVYKAKCFIGGRGEVNSAMKRLRMHVKLDKGSCKQLFEKEVYVWSKLQHPNILPFLGFAFDSDTGYPLLISEWMENGNALAYIRSTSPPPDVLWKLVLDVAHGINYLHVNNIVHSDLKPENIVIGPEGLAMICDFGCARIEMASQSFAAPTSTLKGTCNYWAPELLESGGTRMSKQSDVWAFGMTVFALLTRHAPYSNMSNFTVSLTIHRGSLPDFSVETLQSFDFRIIALRQISFECWNLDPNKRPDMSLISSAMESASKFDQAKAHPYTYSPLLATIHLATEKHRGRADPFGNFLRIPCGTGPGNRLLTKEAQLLEASKEESLCTFYLTGEKLYFASAEVEGSLVPCKAFEGANPMACVPKGGKEYLCESFTILRFNKDLMELVSVNGSDCIPMGRCPVIGGFEVYGPPLYHAVAEWDGHLVPGKASPHLWGISIPYKGEEIRIYNAPYQVLCWKD